MSAAWTRHDIEGLSDERSFARGLIYRQQGRVEIEAHDGDVVTATVRGSMPYRVELRRTPKVSWTCTCPVGDDGDFCKHCVAAALEVADDGSDRAGTRARRAKRDAGPNLRTYLSGLDTDELVDLMLEQVAADWRLRERLTARALASGGGSMDVRSWKQRIDAVFGDDRYFVHYTEAGGWAHDIFEVIDALGDLVDAGHAAAVVGLAEHAYRRADGAVQYVDDSDGWITSISERLGELHLRACEQAKPDPLELAGRLAALELSSELDAFHRAAATYASVLGAEGIAAYRKVVDPKWKAAQKANSPDSYATFRVREAMIGIAQAGGDADALIAIRGADLRTPDAYLEIASELAGAGRHADALDWARRGLATFPERHWQTPPLRQFLAAQLRSEGDDASAEALWWEAYAQLPSLDRYRKFLAESADADAARDRAIGVLRARLEAGDTDVRMRNPLLDRGPTTALAEILMYEGRIDDAWAAASTYGCDERAWMTLARAREATHPLDAIPIYERAVAAHIDTKKNGGYRTAVELLGRIRTLATNAGEPQRFRELLAAVSAEHGRKRNLMALIDERGWT
ncbi:MAG TPA: SWIM zinc finger family protein [Acidothermaceae bacterium]|jgi:uncharacterized Zn finger protein